MNKFDPEITGSLLEEVLQINIVDMGQVNKSENELLVYKHFTAREVRCARISVEHSSESRSEQKPLFRRSNSHNIHGLYSGREA